MNSPSGPEALPEAEASREAPGKGLVASLAALLERWRWAVIALALALTAAAAWAATTLTITTRMEDILSPDLEFLQIERRYKAAFPQDDSIVIVVDAPTSEAARAGAAAIADRLKGNEALFRRVEVPGVSPFLIRHALLYQSPEKLAALGAKLDEVAPLLTALARDANLRGVAQVLTGFARSAGELPPAAARLLGSLADTVEARAAGRPANLAWGALADLGAGGTGAGAGERALVLVTPVVDEASLDLVAPALRRLKLEIATALEAHPGVTTRLTGLPVLRQQELDDAFSGAAWASGLSFVLVTLSLALVRSWRLVAALVLTLIIGSIWTTGLAALAVGRLNLISIAFLVLFFGLGVDFATHFGLRFLEERRRGAAFAAALARSMTSEGPAILLSALCAAIGFLAFVPTAYVGLAEFGIISALGIVVAVIVTFTLLPALMAVMPPRPKTPPGLRIGYGGFVRRHSGAILGAALAATLAAAFVAPRMRMDVNPLNLQDPDTAPVRTFRDLARNPSTSPYAVNAIAPDLAAARELERRLSGIAGVDSVRTLESFVPDGQEAKLATLRGIAQRQKALIRSDVQARPLGGTERRRAFAELEAAAARIAAAAPRNSDAARAAARLETALDRFMFEHGGAPSALRSLDEALTGRFQPFLAQLKGQLSVSAPVTIEDIPPELKRQWLAPDGRARVQVLPAQDLTGTERLRAFARRVQAVAPQATGTPIGVSEAGDAVAHAFKMAILYTAIAIAGVVLLLRRSLSEVALVITPLAVAALWTVASAVIIAMPFNFANVIVIPLIIGLGVASSVHMVVRSRERGGEQQGDVLETSTPLAVLVAQVNTVAAFATLAVADHRGLFSMGVLLGLAVTLVLVASLVVLPAALVLLERRSRAKEMAA